MAKLIESPLENDDLLWMEQALEQAKQAGQEGEVPVGAVMVRSGGHIASGRNQLITLNDPTAHAEIQAIRKSSEIIQNYRLVGMTLYVTLEPCSMCLGAIVHSRIQRLVFATAEPRAGAIISAAAMSFEPFNHSLVYSHGLCGSESSELLKSFFAARR